MTREFAPIETTPLPGRLPREDVSKAKPSNVIDPKLLTEKHHPSLRGERTTRPRSPVKRPVESPISVTVAEFPDVSVPELFPDEEFPFDDEPDRPLPFEPLRFEPELLLEELSLSEELLRRELDRPLPRPLLFLRLVPFLFRLLLLFPRMCWCRSYTSWP